MKYPHFRSGHNGGEPILVIAPVHDDHALVGVSTGPQDFNGEPDEYWHGIGVVVERIETLERDYPKVIGVDVPPAEELESAEAAL